MYYIYIHLLINLFIHLFMFVYSWNYSITYLFACLPIYSFTDLFIYWLFNCLFIY